MARKPRKAEGWSLEICYTLGKRQKHMHMLDELFSCVQMRQATGKAIMEMNDQLAQQAGEWKKCIKS